MNKSTALIPSLILFKRSVATTNFVVFGQTCVNTLPGDWGTPQQAERDKLSPDSTKGWRAKGYPFPLLAKSTWISTSLFHWNRNADGQTVRCSLLKAKRSVMRLNNLPY